MADFESVGNRSEVPETPPICFQIDIQVLAGLFVWIQGEFSRVKNWPILNKKAGPMVLNMADLGKCWKSLKTL